MCKKQTSVFPQFNRITTSDTGPRPDGLPALELWDLIVSVLGNISHISDRTGQPESDDHKHHKSHNEIDAIRDIMLFLQMSNPRVKKLLLNVFEDNEAVIKMIIKGRSGF